MTSKSAKSGKSVKSKTKRSPPKVLLSRITATLRLDKFRSHNKQYDQLEETKSLITDRRGSGDSDTTLVATQVDYSAHLLEILAPLVSALQGITRKISVDMADVAVLQEHGVMCERLLDLINEVRETVLDQEGERDEHDFEMACLMLDALAKKISTERSTLQMVAKQDEKENLIESAAQGNNVQDSPLLPSRNPFIVHSTSISLAPRRDSDTKSQPIGQLAPAAGTYSAYASGAQQTWARNVIRLGSYQNSMLFSPSPVAVRPLVAISHVK
jgi:hypothetical protein